MKKLLFLLFFIPLFSIGQVESFNQIKKITSLELFKRIAIENGYEKRKDAVGDNKIVEYVLAPVYDENEELASANGAAYYYLEEQESDSWRFVFRDNIVGYNSDYNEIYDAVKKDCEFFDITLRKDLEFATYTCFLKGKLGFVEEEGVLYIHYFAQK